MGAFDCSGLRQQPSGWLGLSDSGILRVERALKETTGGEFRVYRASIRLL